MSNKWSDSQMFNFIHLYELHSCLWNSDSADYKNQEKRKAALQNILTALNIPNFTEMDCKNKIKNVRSHYCQELKKIKNSIKNGDGLYKPTLPWFDDLDDFLRPHVVQKSTSYLEMIDQSDTTQDEDMKSQAGNLVYEGGSNENAVDRASPLLQTGNIKSEGQAGDTCWEQTRNVKRKRVDSKIKNNILSVALQKLESISVAAVGRTEFDIFGEGIAAQLKNMPFEEALKLQLEIQQLITTKRINIHNSTAGRQSLETDSLGDVAHC